MAINDTYTVTIDELNEEEAQLYLGGAVLVCVLSAIGIIGNLHVLLVYMGKMKKSNHRVFILCLAILDMITCTIGMPFVVINFRKPFTFYDATICKILTFYNFFICISSACVLVVIAVDRYRKICVPLSKQMSQKAAVIMCFVALVLSLLLSWPALVLYGSSPIETRNPHVTGFECNILAQYDDTNYPLYFNGALLFVAFTSFIVLVVLYCLIGRVIWNHQAFKSKVEETNTEITSIKMKDTPGFKSEVNFHSGSSEDFTEPVSSDNIETTSQANRESVSSKQEIIRRRASSFSEKKIKRTSLQKAMQKFDRTKRTTVMLFWITAVFFISYVPYLTIRIASFMNPDWYESMSHGEKIAYNTFLWCVFINNMANSVIYGFCDQRFRQEVRKGYNKILCRNSQ